MPPLIHLTHKHKHEGNFNFLFFNTSPYGVVSFFYSFSRTNHHQKKKTTTNPSPLFVFDLDSSFFSPSISPSIFSSLLQLILPSFCSWFSLPIDPNFDPIGARFLFLGFASLNILDLFFSLQIWEKETEDCFFYLIWVLGIVDLILLLWFCVNFFQGPSKTGLGW